MSEQDAGKQKIDAATKAAEAVDARKSPSSGPEPTPEEEQAAEKAAPADDTVKESYEEQLERSAEREGEGRVEVANDDQPPLENAS